MRWHLVIVTVSAIAIAPSVTHAQRLVTHARARADSANLVPVVIAASGAVSEGAYQAGVTWAILRGLRMLNTTTDTSLRKPSLGKLAITALSGASAGNINVVMSAMEWCRHDPSTPESSLFAQVWLRVGMGQLNPIGKDDFDEGGLASRQFFKQLWGKLTAARDRTDFDSDCAIPVGVTLTPIAPWNYRVGEQNDGDALYAKTERVVSRWRVKARDSLAKISPLLFVPPDSTLGTRAYGAEYLIDRACDHGRAIVDDSITLRVVEASASFPLAWAAVALPQQRDPSIRTRQHADSVRQFAERRDAVAGTMSIQPPSCQAARPVSDSALYIDGGVFDETPLGLALDLWDADRRGADASRPFGNRTILIRIDPDDERAVLFRNDSIANSRVQATANNVLAPHGGLEPELAMLGGGIPSARQYELQTLGRDLAKSTRDSTANHAIFEHSTRAFPLMGEHFHAFAGFLGRPFRDYDYYVGVYDGLRMVARDFVCRDNLQTDSSRLEACANRVTLNQFVPAIEQAVGRDSIPLVHDLAVCESDQFNGCRFPIPIALNDSLLRARRALIARIAAISYGEYLDPLHAPDATISPTVARCGSIDCDTPVARILWGDGFGAELQALQHDAQFTVYLDSVRTAVPATCWAKEADFGAKDPECAADRAFGNFIAAPEHMMDRAIRWELHRLWRTETAKAQAASSPTRLASSLAELWYTAQSEFAYQRPLTRMNTVPEDVSPHGLPWTLLPDFGGFTLSRGRGWEVGKGLLFAYVRGRDAGFAVSGVVTYRATSTAASTAAYRTVNTGLEFQLRPSSLRTCWFYCFAHVDAGLTYSLESLRRGVWSGRVLTPEVGWVLPYLDKIRIAVRWDPTAPFNPRRSGLAPTFTWRVLDLPGIAYWGLYRLGRSIF